MAIIRAFSHVARPRHRCRAVTQSVPTSTSSSSRNSIPSLTMFPWTNETSTTNKARTSAMEMTEKCVGFIFPRAKCNERSKMFFFFKKQKLIFPSVKSGQETLWNHVGIVESHARRYKLEGRRKNRLGKLSCNHGDCGKWKCPPPTVPAMFWGWMRIMMTGCIGICNGNQYSKIRRGKGAKRKWETDTDVHPRGAALWEIQRWDGPIWLMSSFERGERDRDWPAV